MDKRYVSEFKNRYGEQWTFVYDYVSGKGELTGGDVDWRVYLVAQGSPCGLILNEEEQAWLREAWDEALSRYEEG